MSEKSKLNLYSLNKRLAKLETAEPISVDSVKVDELLERINVLEKIIFSTHAQPPKKEAKPSHPEVWDPTVQARPDGWGRKYAPPVQKTANGTQAKPQKGE